MDVLTICEYRMCNRFSFLFMSLYAQNGSSPHKHAYTISNITITLHEYACFLTC